MGALVYDGHEYELEDRLLAHLQVVITAKLRLSEGFLVNWAVPPEQGSGRVGLWISPRIAIGYRFTGSRRPALNRAWLDALSRSSHGVRGLTVMSEAEAELAATANP